MNYIKLFESFTKSAYFTHTEEHYNKGPYNVGTEEYNFYDENPKLWKKTYVDQSNLVDKDASINNRINALKAELITAQEAFDAVDKIYQEKLAALNTIKSSISKETASLDTLDF